MSTVSRSSSIREAAGRKRLVRAIISLDFLIALLPPLHWMVGGSGSYASLVYFLLVPLLLTISLFVIDGLRDRGEEGQA